MDYLLFLYRGNSRELRKIINALLKSGNVKDLKKINYVQDYRFNGEKVEKFEEKIILIITENQDKLKEFLAKNFDQALKRINIK